MSDTPIYTDENGRMRVSGTRVLIDLVVYAYHQGKTPEQIVQMYPTLTLERVYSAIGYYLRQQDTIDAYIQRMDEEAERIQREVEADYPRKVTRDELLARLNAKQNNIG